MMEEIIKKHPSICYACENSRKPAANSRRDEGYVGCCVPAKKEVNALDFILEAKEIAEGWVDLRSNVADDEGSGMITNLQTLTLNVKRCKEYSER